MRMRIRARIAVALIALSLLALPRTPARAQPSRTGDIANCPIGVFAVLPLAGADPRSQRGRDFIAFLNATAGTTVSGTLWVNASGTPYHVPFANRQTLAHGVD